MSCKNKSNRNLKHQVSSYCK